jgi:hypothetical protein
MVSFTKRKPNRAINIGVTLTSATGFATNVSKPNGDTDSWTPVAYDTDKLKYVIESGDLDQAGNYELQAEYTIDDWSGSSRQVFFYVYATS